MQILLASGSIRSWRPDDAGSLARHANDRRVWRNLRDRFPHPYTPTHARAWIREARKADPETHFAIAVGADAVGGIGLELRTDVFRGSAEIGFWIGQAFWGRGLATEAVRAMTDFAFSRLGLRRLSAGVFEWNGATVRVLEKAGYACEGRLRKGVTKDGQTIDLLLYGIVRACGSAPALTSARSRERRPAAPHTRDPSRGRLHAKARAGRNSRTQLVKRRAYASRHIRPSVSQPGVRRREVLAWSSPAFVDGRSLGSVDGVMSPLQLCW